MTFSVETIADSDWAGVVAARFQSRMFPDMRVCLPTGRTPEPLYEAVASRTSLAGLTIFLLDEFGGLPPDDPGRCSSMLTRDLLTLAGGDPTVHVPDVDAEDPHRAAAVHGDRITGGGLDLAIVGLGANGHIGMNEPGTTIDLGTRVVDLDSSTTANAASYGASVPPTWGITVGMAEIMAAEEVWLVATGAHKRDILNRTLHGPVGSEVPATFLTEHPRCVFFVDESAGSTGA